MTTTTRPVPEAHAAPDAPTPMLDDPDAWKQGNDRLLAHDLVSTLLPYSYRRLADMRHLWPEKRHEMAVLYVGRRFSDGDLVAALDAARATQPVCREALLFTAAAMLLDLRVGQCSGQRPGMVDREWP